MTHDDSLTLDPDPPSPPGPTLLRGPLLGVGGTSCVYTAQQSHLNREIALKEPIDKQHRALVLREAHIMGRLEHPNIPPIYDILQTPEQPPQILMRKIQGHTWDAVMAEKSLDANLQILLQVTHAVSYAHAQGILHRDLKPENIMIGPFGEVMVLDWGLAIQLNDPEPLSLDAAGTPAYMAPEQLGDPKRLEKRGIFVPDLPFVGPPTERTDVFLLGTILYRILSGHAPYSRGGELNAELMAAWECVFVPPRAPAVLVEIARCAMQRAPEARYPSVKAFREALEDWFVIGRVEAAIAQRAPGDAAARLAELHTPMPALHTKVLALQREVTRERELLSQADPRTGLWMRRGITLGAGVLFAVLPLVVGLVEGEPRQVYPVMVGGSGLLLVAGAALALGRRELEQSQINRNALLILLAGFGGQFLIDLVFWWRAESPRLAMALHFLVLALVSVTGISSVHRRMGGAALVFGLGFVAAVVVPAWGFGVGGVVGLLFCAGVVRSWLLDKEW